MHWIYLRYYRLFFMREVNVSQCRGEIKYNFHFYSHRQYVYTHLNHNIKYVMKKFIRFMYFCVKRMYINTERCSFVTYKVKPRVIYFKISFRDNANNIIYSTILCMYRCWTYWPIQNTFIMPLLEPNVFLSFCTIIHRIIDIQRTVRNIWHLYLVTAFIGHWKMVHRLIQKNTWPWDLWI